MQIILLTYLPNYLINTKTKTVIQTCVFVICLQCFVFAERYEEDIEEWYYNLQDREDLMKYLCADRYLTDKDQSILILTSFQLTFIYWQFMFSLTIVAFSLKLKR